MFREKFFNKVCFLSVVSVFLLFILGGIVRSTGSGMGCPDWPKCFGQTIPPLDESQLPQDYKEQFLSKRLKKVEKFTTLLNKLGLHELADKVQNDPNLKIAHPYDKFTAYTEWINRLFGVLTGIFSVLCLISSRQFISTDKKRFWRTLSAVFWVIFNGWLGSVVVDTNLVPGIVTAHYAAAYLAMGSFIAAMPVSHPFIITKGKFYLLLFALFLLLVEVFTGTSTREILDTLQINENFVLSIDSVWLPGTVFNIHRVMGILIFLINIYLLYSVRHQKPRSNFALAQKWVVILLIFQILSGTFNTLFNIPALVNVVHISASAAVVGIQLWLVRNRE